MGMEKPFPVTGSSVSLEAAFELMRHLSQILSQKQ